MRRPASPQNQNLISRHPRIPERWKAPFCLWHLDRYLSHKSIRLGNSTSKFCSTLAVFTIWFNFSGHEISVGHSGVTYPKMGQDCLVTATLDVYITLRQDCCWTCFSHICDSSKSFPPALPLCLNCQTNGGKQVFERQLEGSISSCCCLGKSVCLLISSYTNMGWNPTEPYLMALTFEDLQALHSKADTALLDH